MSADKCTNYAVLDDSLKFNFKLGDQAPTTRNKSNYKFGKDKWGFLTL